MQNRPVALLVGLLLFSFSTLSTRWSDSFVEWEIYAWAEPDSTLTDDDVDVEPEEELIGEMKLRWLQVKEDWSEWEFQLRGERGTIKAKWRNDLTQWELRTYSGQVITMRTAWPNDNTQWRITDNSVSLLFKSRWTNLFDEWQCEDKAHGNFYVSTLRRNDPRDWAIDDQCKESVSEYLKLAMMFITVLQCSPKM
jgi:hypothetical protein